MLRVPSTRLGEILPLALFSLLALTLVACGDDDVIPDVDSGEPPPIDGGGDTDSGTEPTDGGIDPDGGEPADGGEPTDAGMAMDGGEPTDSGIAADGGDPTDGGVADASDGGTADSALPSTCTSDAECGAAEFCNHPTGGCGMAGACEATPFICPGSYDPVCGCDGVTYSNECNANNAGTSVAAVGECVVAGGCTTNADCAAAEFCNHPTGGCGMTGACEATPFFCAGSYDPVCGCDGATYANECNANNAGTSVAAVGECVVAGGCTSNADCAAAEFCNHPAGACGTTGACEATPFFCAGIYDPVCGCDGATYSNECNANNAGTSVGAVGACP